MILDNENLNKFHYSFDMYHNSMVSFLMIYTIISRRITSLIEKELEIDYSVFHQFRRAEFGGSILGSSQFSLIPQLLLK